MTNREELEFVSWFSGISIFIIGLLMSIEGYSLAGVATMFIGLFLLFLDFFFWEVVL